MKQIPSTEPLSPASRTPSPISWRGVVSLVTGTLVLLSLAGRPGRAADPKPIGDRHQPCGGRQLFVNSAGHYGSSPFDPPKGTDTTFVVDRAPGLDTGCSYRSDGPLYFNIEVTRVVGDVARLKQNGLIGQFATLRMPAYDIDFYGGGFGTQPERDRVSFNGHIVPTEYLTGDDSVWKLNGFQVPIEWVNFATPNPGGAPTPGINTIRIDIDVANASESWCMAIDWAALSIEAARPTVLVHGSFGGPPIWQSPSGINWSTALQQAGLPEPLLVNLPSTRSYTENARTLGTRVDDLRARLGVDQVTLIGHDRGGVDARKLAEGSADIDRLIQIGTANAGTPLADAIQSATLQLPPDIRQALSGLAGRGGAYQTTAYMNLWNEFHGRNRNVTYVSLAGNYQSPVFKEDAFVAEITGQSGQLANDGIVPVSSAHALSYAEKPVVATIGSDLDARHAVLTSGSGNIAQTNSARVFALVLDRLRSTGSQAPSGSGIRVGRQALAPAAGLGQTATATGAIQQGQVRTHTLPVDRSAPAYFSVLYPSGNLDLTLVSPSGQRFDRTNIGGNPNISVSEGDLSGAKFEVFRFAAPQVGLWTVEVRAPQVTDPSGATHYAVNGWISGSTLSLAAGAERLSVRRGETLQLRAVLSEGGAALPGATVSAQVTLPDQTTIPVALHDDGINGDGQANDGIYSGDFDTTVQPGNYPLVVTATGLTGAGAPFSRSAYALATVSRSATSFSGSYQDSGLDDSDPDLLFNVLRVRVGVNVTDTTTYRLRGILKDGQGHSHEATVEAELNPGAATLDLEFSGEDLYDGRVSGPYRLASLALAEVTDTDVLPVDYAQNAYDTAGYNFRVFQHDAIALTGAGASRGVDTNANGLFDLLETELELDLQLSGYYSYSGRLIDRTGHELGFVAGDDYFSSGLHTLTFNFNGLTIGQNAVDGPFYVVDLLVDGPGVSLVATSGLTTQALRAARFEGYPVSLVGVSIAPTTVEAGSTGQGTVTLNGPAPTHGTVVELESLSPNVVSVPATVLVPGGQTTATFPVETLPIVGQQAATIRAMLGLVSHTAALTTTFPDSSTDRGTVIGSGTVDASELNGGLPVFSTFRLNVVNILRRGKRVPYGSFSLRIPDLGYTATATRLTAMRVNGKTASLFGTLRIRTGVEVPFRLEAADLGQPGVRKDRLVLTYVDNGQAVQVGGVLLNVRSPVGNEIRVRP